MKYDKSLEDSIISVNCCKPQYPVDTTYAEVDTCIYIHIHKSMEFFLGVGAKVLNMLTREILLSYIKLVNKKIITLYCLNIWFEVRIYSQL